MGRGQQDGFLSVLGKRRGASRPGLEAESFPLGQRVRLRQPMDVFLDGRAQVIPAGTTGTSDGRVGANGESVDVWWDAPICSASMSLSDVELTEERFSDLQRGLLALIDEWGSIVDERGCADEAEAARLLGCRPREVHDALYILSRLEMLAHDHSTDPSTISLADEALEALGALRAETPSG